MVSRRVAVAAAVLLFAGCGRTVAQLEADAGLTCAAGFSSCGSGSSAYCASTMTDNANCGACGVICGNGQTCQSGACACPAGEALSNDKCCPAGQTSCGGTCVNTQNDPNHCGACSGASAVCTGGTVCSGGACQISCPGSQVNCDGSCVDSQTDSNHCGAKGLCDGTSGNSTGTVCAGGQTCQSGA